jgi:branched-subunit amino acid transport protein
MNPTLVWGLIAGMGITNILVRALPIAVISRFELPEVARRWLSYVPVSVMAAMVALEVLKPNNQWQFTLANPYLLAAIPTALVYRLTRSFLGATVVGIVAFLAFRYLLG